MTATQHRPAGESFGQKVERFRLARGLSRRALAARAGIGNVSLHRLVHGQNQPLFATAQALARALGVPLEELADE